MPGVSNNGWKTCSRGHKFRGKGPCPKCWPGGRKKRARPTEDRRARTLRRAIAKADAMLPGEAAPEGEHDPRWEAIMETLYYIETHPEEVWTFTAKWGSHPHEDTRMAIAVILLEHLLEYHFDLIFPRVEQLAKSNPLFADTFGSCWMFGQSEEPKNAAKFNRLLKQVGRRPRNF